MRALCHRYARSFASAREMQAALEEFVRRERLGVSTIALPQFMQALFEEKLASQKEALLQGKQLADIIALQNPGQAGPDSVTNLETHGATTSTPALRSLAPPPAQRQSSGLIAGALGMAAAMSVVGGAAWWFTHHDPGAGLQPPSAAAQQGVAASGALAIASDPPGATIVINGARRPEKTPATIGKLALGLPYQITLSKDGFRDTAQSVTLTEQEPSGAMSLALQRATLAVDVSLNPPAPGATLILDGKPYASTTIDKVTAGESHQLVVQAPGYASQSLSFVGAPDEHKHLDVALTHADPAKVADRSARGAPVPAPGAPPAAQAPAPAPPAPAPAVASGTGKLNVSARGGWCNVTIDGTAHGPTPIAGVVLPAGSHAVVCTPEGGKPLTASVHVEPDSTARYSFPIAP
jgi:serine/threonine-protein kinase